MSVRHETLVHRSLIRELVAGGLLLGALIAVGIELSWLLDAEAGAPNTAIACVLVGVLAFAAPQSSMQVGSRIAGLAAVAIGFPAAVLAYMPSSAVAVSDVDRLAGTDAAATAVAVSTGAFDRSPVVVIVSSRQPESAVAAGALAADLDAPVLLTAPDSLRPDVVEELERLEAETAFLVGEGLSDHIGRRLDDLGVASNHMAGTERQVAAQVARHVESDRVLVVVADDRGGHSEPATVAVIAAAAADGTPVIYSTSQGLGLESAAVLLDTEPGMVMIHHPQGSPATSLRVELRRLLPVAAVQTAPSGGPRLPSPGDGPVWIASARSTADVLVAGAAAAHTGALMVIDHRDPDHVTGVRLAAEADPGRRRVAVGGRAALPDEVLERR